MKIGYCKIGRSWKLDPTKGTTTGGDADVARALHMLSRLRPDDEFVLVGRNSGEVATEAGYPANVTNPWTDLLPVIKAAKVGSDMNKTLDLLSELTLPLFMDLDAIIVWAGQHGTSNMPLPMVDDRATVTTPQISFVNYASYILKGINAWRDVDPDAREEIWLCPDPRNYLKCRDLKWPLSNSIIAQYEYERTTKHERYGDLTPPSVWDSTWDPDSGNEGVWVSPSRYTYDALELTALPNPARLSDTVPWDDRQSFGMIVNENRAYVAKDRLSVIRDWVLPNWPQAEIFGTWTEKSKQALGRPDIRPCPYQYLGSTLQRWRSTLTTPASGSGWATAKPWECFAYGTVCFFHPHYDTQDWILRDAPARLHDWLRVSSPEELAGRVAMMNADASLWSEMIAMQYEHFVRKYNENLGGVAEVMRRLG